MSDSSSSSSLSPLLMCGNMSVYRVFLHVCMCKCLFSILHMWKSEDKFQDSIFFFLLIEAGSPLLFLPLCMLQLASLWGKADSPVSAFSGLQGCKDQRWKPLPSALVVTSGNCVPVVTLQALTPLHSLTRLPYLNLAWNSHKSESLG